MTVGPLPDLPDFCWPVDPSCIPDWDAWEVEPDPEADPPVEGIPVYTDAEKARATALAGQSLRYLTGFRVGGCPITVRPASQGCQSRNWRTYPVNGVQGSVPWQPVNIGGSWLNIGCGHQGGCGCLGLKQIRLGRVGSIAQVKVDGMVLSPDAYRIDPGGLLVRLDGDTWPLCQDMALSDDADGTWSVTYIPGAPVDGIGAWVAGVLTGEYLQACRPGSDCRLPDTVTQIVRQGVTMTLTPGAFPNGLTGIREVDAYITRWNPNGLQGQPAVYSPDVHRPRRVGSVPFVPAPGVIISGGDADPST